jgi:hypothetical protein
MNFIIKVFPRVGSRFALLAVLWLLPTADLAAASYSLTINTNGSGTVSRNPTNSLYPAGSVVTLTAAPTIGWYFEAWTGDAAGTENPLNVAMTSNKVITASFAELARFTLTTSTNGKGSVSLDPPGGRYLSNSVVSATASPATGWVFVNWNGDASGQANPLPITVDRDKALAALFAQLPVIVEPPQNMATEIGSAVNFSVQAAGTPPLTYQWWFDSSKLDGATNQSLPLSSVQLDQEGTYSVTVSNTYGGAQASATLTITNACSGTNVVSIPSETALREAIAAGGVVTFCFNGTITLSNTVEITRDVALDARGRSVSISGNNSVRLFQVNSGVKFAATNLVFRDGHHVGQAGVGGAPLDSPPAIPGTPGEGGAIISEGGIVQLSRCTLMGNSVTGGKGAPAIAWPGSEAPPGDGLGAAILVRGGSLLLDSVNLYSNTASGGPGYLDGLWTGDGRGGALYITNASVVLARCNLSNNICTAPLGNPTGSGFGGAVFLASGSLAISNSAITANVAYLPDMPLIFQAARNGSAYGGALAAESGTVNLVRCHLTSNVARGGNAFRVIGSGEGKGGGIFSTANVMAWDSTFSDNQALAGSHSFSGADGRGGAFFNAGNAALNGCSLVSNLAAGGSSRDIPSGNALGGGIFNVAQLMITNCTLAQNSAVGGTANDPNYTLGSGLGGGLFNSNVLTAVNVTIASNTVQGSLVAGGAAVANAAGTLTLYNSIIAYAGSSSNAWGTITDGGFNISSDGSANFNSGSSFNFTDPLLKALGDYGGPTSTMALDSDSPAVDFGASAGAPLTDQRGLARPAGPGVDIGAFELQSTSPQIPKLVLSEKNGELWLSFQMEPNLVLILQGTSNLTDWADLEQLGPFSSETEVLRLIDSKGSTAKYFRLRTP